MLRILGNHRKKRNQIEYRKEKKENTDRNHQALAANLQGLIFLRFIVVM